MSNLSAARAARTSQVLSKTVSLTDGSVVTFDDLLDSGSVSYTRVRTRKDKKEYGVILQEDVLNAHSSEDDNLAQALSRVSFYAAPKMVVDAIEREGIRRLEFNVSTDDFFLV